MPSKETEIQKPHCPVHSLHCTWKLTFKSKLSIPRTPFLWATESAPTLPPLVSENHANEKKRKEKKWCTSFMQVAEDEKVELVGHDGCHGCCSIWFLVGACQAVAVRNGEREKWVKRNIYQKWRSQEEEKEEEEEEVNGICINNPTPHSLATHPTFSPYSPQSNRNKNSWHGTIAIALWSTITPVIMICICSIKTRYVKTQFSGRKLYTQDDVWE